MNYLILTFQSTHHVLKAERVLLSQKMKFEIIPTPKEISSECGMSIRVNPQFMGSLALNKVLADANLEFNIFEKPME